MSNRPPICLNYDILCRILQYITAFVSDIDERDAIIAAISRTCKSLRFEGVKCLLSRTVSVDRTRCKRIASFCHFMLADPVRRIPLLRFLIVNVAQVTEENVGLLAEVFRASTDLTYLKIIHLESLPSGVNNVLCPAIASLPSLTRLVIEAHTSERFDVNTALDKMIRSMRSSVHSIRVTLPYFATRARRIKYSRKRDPVFFLSPLKDTLEIIELGGPVTVGGYTCEFPHVKQLTIPDYVCGMSYLKTYSACFPNLHSLRCGPADTLWARHGHQEDLLKYIGPMGQTVQQVHDLNQRDFLEHPHPWLMLDSFTGSVLDGYVLQLPHVNNVRLFSTGGMHSAESAMLSVLLPGLHPTFLRFATKVEDQRGYIPIFPPLSTWAESLTSLELRINIMKQRFDFDECFVSRIKPQPVATYPHLIPQEHIIETLRSSSIVSLRLEFRCANTSSQHRELGPFPWELQGRTLCGLPGSRRSLCYTQRALSQDNLLQRVRDVMNHLPTLRKMVLVWARCDTWAPDRVIGINLDSMPHSIDRPGDNSDGWNQLDDYYW